MTNFAVNKLARAVCIAPWVLATGVCLAQNSGDIHRRNLEMLSAIKTFCDTPPPQGRWTTYDLRGTGHVAASGLVRRLVDIGVQVHAGKSVYEYTGYLQEALSRALQDSYQCRSTTIASLRELFQIPREVGNVSSFVNKDSAAGAAASGDSACVTSAGPGGASVTCRDSSGNVSSKSSK